MHAPSRARTREASRPASLRRGNHKPHARAYAGLRLDRHRAAREIDRLTNPELRVARNLAALFNPALFPGVGQVLRITQQELAYLVGLSRQRVNEALRTLEGMGIIRVEYGGLRVLDLAALRTSTFSG